MRSFFAGRWGHGIALLGVCCAVMLPNLGAHSLWDVDEGVNAEAAREMDEVGTWIVPTFNSELRTAKPVFLYWLQRISYLAFGVSEWSARLPSVLLSMGTVLLVYDLGRRMFGAAAGLLGGLILATAIEFCKLAHAATPDAPLIFFVTLTFHLFWIGHQNGGRSWFYTASVASALATLTKGPVGLALPALSVFVYLLWCRELHRLWDRLLIKGLLLWFAVAAPWYILVTSETRGLYAKAFFGTENFGRFSNAMEGHSGSPVYYLIALLLFFAPWSIFLFGTVWVSVQESRRPLAPEPRTRAIRFLLSWFGCYLLFFTIASTKLPNYIGPLYPAVALLTADFLARWRSGERPLPRWFMPASTVWVAIIGLAITFGLLVAGGEIALPIKGLRVIPSLAKFAPFGLIFVLAALGMAYFLRRSDRGGVLASLTAATIVFIGLTAAYPVVAWDDVKAPKHLVRESGAFDLDRDIRIASLDYTTPSVTFYSQREVERMPNGEKAAEFLSLPRPGYLFVPEPVWERTAKLVTAKVRIAARHYDYLRNCDVLVITND